MLAPLHQDTDVGRKTTQSICDFVSVKRGVLQYKRIHAACDEALQRIVTQMPRGNPDDHQGFDLVFFQPGLCRHRLVLDRSADDAARLREIFCVPVPPHQSESGSHTNTATTTNTELWAGLAQPGRARATSRPEVEVQILDSAPQFFQITEPEAGKSSHFLARALRSNAGAFSRYPCGTKGPAVP